MFDPGLVGYVCALCPESRHNNCSYPVSSRNADLRRITGKCWKASDVLERAGRTPSSFLPERLGLISFPSFPLTFSSHSQVQTVSFSQVEALNPLAITSFLTCAPLAVGDHQALFCVYKFVCSDVSYKWNHTVVILVMGSSTSHNFFKSRSCCRRYYGSFLFMA